MERNGENAAEHATKLILAIVNQDDMDRLVEALTRHNYRSTVFSTTGGFLRKGNSAIMVGTEEVHLPEILRLIKETCHKRTEISNPFLSLRGPAEVQVGGATVFVLRAEVLHPLLNAMGDICDTPSEKKD